MVLIMRYPYNFAKSFIDILSIPTVYLIWIVSKIHPRRLYV